MSLKMGPLTIPMRQVIWISLNRKGTVTKIPVVWSPKRRVKITDPYPFQKIHQTTNPNYPDNKNDASDDEGVISSYSSKCHRIGRCLQISF